MISRERRAIEATYGDKCSIYNFAKVKENSITKSERVLATEDIACALSQKSLSPVSRADAANEVKYDAKLFLSPEVEVLPGCEIEVRQGATGRLLKYCAVGESMVYVTHQEVILKREDKA